MLVQKHRLESLYREINHNNRLAYCIVGAICGIVAVLEFHELYQDDSIYNGYKFVIQTIQPACAWDSLPYSRGGINWYMVCVSYMVFDNSRVVPFMMCLALLPVSFLFARKYGSNLAGLLVAGGLALNPVFLAFDTSSAYAQTWALFFLSSLYLIKKIPLLSAVTFNLSLFSKAIPMAWGPFIIYGIFRSSIPQNKKYLLYAGIGLPLIILYSLSIFDGGSMVYGYLKLKPITWDSFHDTILITWSAFRWNEEILVATPIIFALYLWKRKSWNMPAIPFELLAVSMVSFLGITFFTVEGYFPYRLIPNIAVFLFAASMLFQRGLEHRLRL